MSMIKTYKKSREEVQRIQELRRSNSAMPHRNKSKYSRKPKHHKGWEYAQYDSIRYLRHNWWNYFDDCP